MRIERFYSSVKEEVAPLTDDADSLIQNNDYIGFFKACGPNYIRSIRRAQEVVAFFIWESTSTERSSQYATSISVSHWWYNRKWDYGRSQSQSTKSESSSTRIIIKGYGLGLTQEGSESLVAQNLQDYTKVMKFAFRTMTQLKGESIHTGMVYGMEVVPWVANSAFQVASNLLDEVIEIPQARSLIPRSYRLDDFTSTTFDNTDATTRNLNRCKDITYSMDKYGYCCEVGALYDYVNKEYNQTNPSERICRPLRQLDPVFIKDNLAANGEFVARLDRAVRYKLNQLSLLERCMSAVRAIPSRYDFYVLQPSTNNVYDGAMSLTFSVFELKMALDPYHDGAMLSHMGKELDEFLDMFVQPCYSALFGSNILSSPGGDPSYFMAYPWHTHNECNKLSCMGLAMRWDRTDESGGCVPSLISGATAPGYVTNGEPKCLKAVENGEMVCKHKSAELAATHRKTVNCWAETIPRGSVNYFMENYCMPTIKNEVLPTEAKQQLVLKNRQACNDSGEILTVNVAAGMVAKQSSNYNRNDVASVAVNDDPDRYNNKGSHTHTKYEYEPWWYVELGEVREISTIEIFNRVDCCRSRLRGFTLIITNAGAEVVSVTYPGTPDLKTVLTPPDDHPEPFYRGDKVEIKILGRSEYLSLAQVRVLSNVVVDNAFRGTLMPNESIYSSNYEYQLIYQSDGNLVLYEVKTRRVPWASHTWQQSTGRAEMTENGNFVVYDADDLIQWESGTNSPDAYVLVKNDGTFVVNDSSGTPIWTC